MMVRKDNLVVGMMLGAIAGAVYVQGNRRAQQMVQKGKNVVKKQMNKMN